MLHRGGCVLITCLFVCLSVSLAVTGAVLCWDRGRGPQFFPPPVLSPIQVPQCQLSLSCCALLYFLAFDSRRLPGVGPGLQEFSVRTGPGHLALIGKTVTTLMLVCGLFYYVAVYVAKTNFKSRLHGTAGGLRRRSVTNRSATRRTDVETFSTRSVISTHRNRLHCFAF